MSNDYKSGSVGDTFTKYNTPITLTNVGTVGTGVTAVEYGDAYNHTTVLTINAVDAITVADTAALPAGRSSWQFQKRRNCRASPPATGKAVASYGCQTTWPRSLSLLKRWHNASGWYNGW